MKPGESELASGVASNLAGILGEPKQNRRHAAASGAAAGLAAAFNTPLAAITFVLEEIVQDLNSRFLGSVLLASVIGAFAVHFLAEKNPALEIFAVGAPDWTIYLLTPLVATTASLVVFENSGRRDQSSKEGINDHRPTNIKSGFHVLTPNRWVRPYDLKRDLF